LSAALLTSPAFSRMVGDIYDCILDRGHWPEVLGELCERSGGCAASLNVHVLPDLTPRLLAEHGTDPVYSQRYIEEYGRINPLLATAVLGMAEGELGVLSRIPDLGDYYTSPFYREWVAPQGWGDWAAGVLQRGQDRVALLAVARKAAEGPFRTQQIRFLRLVLPHVQRATMLGRLLDVGLAQRDGMAALIDRLSVAALLVDPAGRIIHANAPAEAMLETGELLRADGSTLRLEDPPAAEALATMLAASPGSEARLVPVATHAGRRVLSLLPATAESGGLAVVLATLPEPNAPLPGELLARAYGLTPGETRVLLPLLGGRSLQGIADDLGITHRTVKAHLHSVFTKTGTARQSDLLREVLHLLPPLRAA